MSEAAEAVAEAAVPAVPAEVECPVEEFYAGAEVLLTGATGFVGRVLLEKTLRSCPRVARVFVLLRPKKGVDPQERVKQISNVPLFDQLKREQPEALSKVHVVVGDVSKPRLGLSDEDMALLERRVSVIMHLAASVRFDDPLAKAVAINVRGTHEIAQLATRCKNLKVVVYTSTTYCCITPNRVVKEEIYPAPADWRAVLQMVETADPDVLRIITPLLLGEHPNTYTFTKALAEHVMLEYSSQVPIVIGRPSVVVSTFSDPFPGWIDSYLGVVGLMVGAGKGVVHTGYVNPKCQLDYIPVDIVAKGLLVGGWYLYEHKEEERLHVYNMAQGEVERMTMGEVIDLGRTLASELPLSPMLYYPSGGVTDSKLYFHFMFFFTHILPALLVDSILFVIGRKPLLFRIQRKIYVANLALYFFVKDSWYFENKKGIALDDGLLSRPDFDNFATKYEEVNAVDFFRRAHFGCKKYLLKEEDTPAAHVTFARLRILHYVLMAVLYMIGLWVFAWRLGAVIYALWPCDILLEHYLKEKQMAEATAGT